MPRGQLRGLHPAGENHPRPEGLLAVGVGGAGTQAGKGRGAGGAGTQAGRAGGRRGREPGRKGRGQGVRGSRPVPPAPPSRAPQSSPIPRSDPVPLFVARL